jgi:hypothetical protein
MKTLIAVMMTVFLMTGCTVIRKIEESPMTAELITNQLTLRFIAGADDPVERATKLRATLDKIQGDMGAEYTLADLDEAVRAEIDWQALNAADQELLNFALTKARVAIAELIGDGVVNPDERYRVETLIRWIDQAAQRVR